MELDHLVPLEILASLDLLVQVVQPDHLVNLVQLVKLVILVLLDLLDLQVLVDQEETQGKRDSVDQVDLKEKEGQMDHQDPVDLRAHLEAQVKGGRLGQQDRRDKVVLQDHLESVEIEDLQDQQDLVVQQDHQGQVARVEPRVKEETPVLLAQVDRLVKVDKQALKEN